MEPPPNLTLFRRGLASVFALLPPSLPPSLLARQVVTTRQVAATSWRDKSYGHFIQNLHPSPFCFRLRGAPVFTELRRGKSARRADAASRRIVMSSHCPPTLSIPAGTPGMVSLLLVSFAVASRADNCSITNPPPPPVPFLKTGDASYAMGCHILSKP